MYVYDRKTGKYVGRAGKPVRDVKTGKPQKMSSGPPRRPGGCFAGSAALVLLAASPFVAAGVAVAHWV